MRRLADAAFYLGLIALAAATALTLTGTYGRQVWAVRLTAMLWWPLVAAGIVLVVLSALPWRDGPEDRPPSPERAADGVARRSCGQTVAASNSARRCPRAIAIVST